MAVIPYSNNTMTTSVGAGGLVGTYTNINAPWATSGIMAGSTSAPWNYIAAQTNGMIPSNVKLSPYTDNILTINRKDDTEIVKLKIDGTVEWADGINMDEAAESFGNTLRLGAEMAAGIKYSNKCQIRNTIFEEIILMANNKGGSLTADDLTFMLSSAKMMDKLKGL